MICKDQFQLCRPAVYLIYPEMYIIKLEQGPIVITLTAFGAYSFLGNQLTAEVAFPALAMLQLLNFPLLSLASCINLVRATQSHAQADLARDALMTLSCCAQTISGSVAIGRLQAYLEVLQCLPVCNSSPPSSQISTHSTKTPDLADRRDSCAGAQGASLSRRGCDQRTRRDVRLGVR